MVGTDRERHTNSLTLAYDAARKSVIRFHDLRHTHASLLLKLGVPVKVISELRTPPGPGAWL